MHAAIYRVRFAVVIVILVSGFNGCSSYVSKVEFLESIYSFPGLDETSTYIQPVADTDVLALTEGMKAFVEREVMKYSSRTRRLKALNEALFDPRKLALVYDGNETRTASQVFQTSTGDCLSFANLFVAMARYAGLEARYQNVDIPLDWDRGAYVTVLNKHINVFGYINSGESYTVDILPYRVNVKVDASLVSDDSARAQYFNNKGVEFFQKGNGKEALRYFKRAVLIDADIGFIWSNAGIVYSHAGRYETAELFFKKALLLDLYDLSAMSNLASLYKKIGNETKALHYTRKVRSYRWRNPYYRYALGVGAYERGDYQLAAAHLKYAAKKKSDEYIFHLDLAKAYYRLGKYSKAEQNYQKARKVAPEDKKMIYQIPLERLLAEG